MLFLGGVHGDENNGVKIVCRIILKKINKPSAGTIICIKVFNIFGFLHMSRKFADGRNLNRIFPSSSKGLLTSQFAHEFKNEIAPFIDYVIDFHAAGANRVNVA